MNKGIAIHKNCILLCSKTSSFYPYVNSLYNSSFSWFFFLLAVIATSVCVSTHFRIDVDFLHYIVFGWMGLRYITFYFIRSLFN